jgi:hypothetical protein
MKIIVDTFTRSEWALHSEQAHLICFGTHKPAAWDRFDFTLVARTEETLLGYVTCREHDKETLYWQFGGAFPTAKGTIASWRTVEAMIDWCKKKYRRVSFLVENDNAPMLKMALKLNARIIGTRTFKGGVLLEHLIEFEGEGA